MLTADVDDAGLPPFVAVAALQEADILQAPHHGSALGSFGAALMSSVHPQLVVISCRPIGSWRSCPSVDLQRELDHLDIPFITTAAAGTITVESNGRTWAVMTEHGTGGP